MTFALKFIVAMVGVFWLAIAGAWGMAWWDRRPPNYPAIHLHVLFVHWTWTAPESLKAQLAASAVDLKQCRLNGITLEAAIARQNASLTALADASRKATSEVENAVHASQGQIAGALKAKASISAPVVGDDVCARAKVVDQRFVESLR